MPSSLRSFCGTPEPLSATLLTRPSRATWALVSDLPGILHDALRAAIAQAAAEWEQVADVHLDEARDPAGADLLIRCGPIDGPQGILAETELPGPVPQHMLLDSAERWVVYLGKDVPVQEIDLVRVLAHELGHFWGLGHDLAPGSRSLMAPTYNPLVDHPQVWDVQQIVSRYGPPRPVPPPMPPADGPAPGSVITIRVHNADRIEIPGYTVTKQ